MSRQTQYEQSRRTRSRSCAKTPSTDDSFACKFRADFPIRVAKQDIANQMQQRIARPGTRLSRRMLLRGLGVLAGTFPFASRSHLFGEKASALPTFEESTFFTKRHHLDTYRRQICGKTSARDQRSRLRISRLRQRWMDGHLSREQRQGGVLRSSAAAAQCALPQQSRRNIHRRDGESWGGWGRLRHGCCRGRLRRRWFSGHLRHPVRAQHSVPQQRRRHIHRRDRESRRCRCGMELQRGLV